MGAAQPDISTLSLASAYKLGVPLFFILLTLVEFVTIGKKTNQELNQNLNLHKNLNKKIRRSEAKYRRLIEGVGDIVAEIDGQSKFSYVNQAFVKLSGYSKEELIGKPFYSLLNKEESAGHLNELNEQINNRKTMAYSQFKIYTKSGKAVWLGQNRSMFYDEAGNVVSCTCMARDTTIQKEVNDLSLIHI